jgi:cysteinyl-tRNA synthetase
VVNRYLRHLGYRVRYVRNITDVGHLENEAAGSGEDKIAKQARVSQLEPMEVVQKYTVAYRKAMDRLGVLPPSIEPTASGHIPEQIAFVQRILENGYAYVVDGSVYFDLTRFAAQHPYGQLSGKVVDDLVAGTRDTEGREEKRGPLDFALWKKADPSHLMQWDSPWGRGFPGWHIECTVMSTKYLGEEFDIHGGGMDIQFPHHEAEIAQSVGGLGHPSVRQWMHHNMVTIDGQKMAKSLGNFITMDQLFTGDHERLDQAYDPMTIRFFMLQTHYRSPVDFSNEPLKAAERGYQRLQNVLQTLEHGWPQATEVDRKLDGEVEELLEALYLQMSDDFNTPQALATVFDLGSRINRMANGESPPIGPGTTARLRATLPAIVQDVFGLGGAPGETAKQTTEVLDGAIRLLIEIREKARKERDFQTSDAIRDRLAEIGVQLEDGRDGTSFSLTQVSTP